MEGELPPGWTEHTSPFGAKYYYHAETGTSTWERPVVQKLTTTSITTIEVVPATQQQAQIQQPQILQPAPKRVRIVEEEPVASVVKRVLPISDITTRELTPDRKRAILDEQRQKLDELLSSRDSILDPHIFDWLKNWIIACETLATINELKVSLPSLATQAADKLSKSYSGCGDEASVLGEWLDVISAGKREDTAAFLGMTRLKEIVLESKISELVLDELLLQYENIPHWIAELLEVREWRSLFIELASKNRTSPFLNFCVRYIAEAGFYEEVTQTNLTATNYFSVFSRTVTDLLTSSTKICASSNLDGISLGKHLNRLINLAKSTPYSSLFFGQLLSELEFSHLNPQYQELNEKLKDEKLSEQIRWMFVNIRQRVQPLSILLLNKSGLRQDSKTANDILLNVVNDEVDACEACVGLSACFLSSVDHSSENKLLLPTWPLCERDFLDRLIGGLFRPSRKIKDEVRKAACTILAVASYSKQTDQAYYALQVCDGDGVNGTSQDFGQNEIETLIQNLMNSSTICNSNETIGYLHTQWNENLRQICKDHPAVSMGMLFFIRALLDNNDFQKSHNFSQGFLSVCDIAQFIALNHPLQRPHVFGVLKLAFMTKPPPDAYYTDARLAELSESVVDAFVELMSLGFVLPVLDYFVQIAPELDLSLLRKFLLGTLYLVEPPYSKLFFEKFNSLLETPPGIRAGIGGGAEFAELKSNFLKGTVI